MRIIHDVDFPMDPGAGWNGHRLDLHATTSRPANHPEIAIPAGAWPEDEINIEGDPQYLIPLLEGWLSAAKRIMDLVKVSPV